MILYLNEKMIEVGARDSSLSRIQVKEVQKALLVYHPQILFIPQFFQTVGDLDQKTSLRHLDRTDFFTREIDQWVLAQPGRVGIHSAKDLPYPLSTGLSIFCLTEGLDPADVVVLREGETWEQLPVGACIATSSERREQMVRILRSTVTFCDIRGTIEQRLAQLDACQVDGVVVAEAALIRLGLTHRSRIRLPGLTAEGQGQLAVVGQTTDEELKQLFACLDVN